VQQKQVYLWTKCQTYCKAGAGIIRHSVNYTVSPPVCISHGVRAKPSELCPKKSEQWLTNYQRPGFKSKSLAGLQCCKEIYALFSNNDLPTSPWDGLLQQKH